MGQLRFTLGANAAADAALRFDLDLQLERTTAWYREIITDWRDWRDRKQSGDRRLTR